MGVDLLRVSPTGEVTTTEIYSQHCATSVRPTLCDHAPLLKEIFPDGIDGTLVRAFVYTSAAPLIGEMRLARVVGGAIQFNNSVDPDERTTMIGGAGKAFLSGDDARMVDVTNWNSVWSHPNPALAPVATLADGRFAMHDVADGTLTEFTANGTSVQSAAFGGGYQTGLGLFTKVENAGSTPTLTSRVSLPLREDINIFRAARGSGSLQNSPEPPPGRTRQQDETAILLMRYLYLAPNQKDANGQQLEHGGHICREPDMQHYYYLHLGTGTTVSAPPLILEPEKCKIGTTVFGTTVGYAHSHPGAFPNFAYPSGFGSQAEYYDNDLNPATTPNTSDLLLADQYFDQVYGPKGPNVMWYVTSMEKPQPFVKYKKTSTAPAKDNVWRYNYGTSIWDRVPAPW